MENKHNIGLKGVFKYVCFIFLILQILTIICLNLTRSEQFFDYDSSLVLRHAVEMWSHKTIALPDYNMTSSLEIDCAAFWAAPLYILTKNISLSYTIVHMILILIVLYTVNAVLSQNDVKPAVRFITMSFIITPYTFGQLEYMNMLFISAGQYEFRLIIVLLLLYFTGLDIKKTPKKKWTPLMVLFLFFLIVTTVSCGTYVPVLIVGPFLGGLILSWIIKKKICVSDFTAIFLLGSGAVSVISLMIRSMINIGVASSNGYFLCTSQNFTDNLLSCLAGILIILGGVPQISDVNAATIFGLVTILKFVGCISIFFFVYWCCTKNTKIKKDNYFLYCICFAVCNLLVLILSDTRYGSPVFESRYHILWIIAIFMLSGVCLDKYLKLKNEILNRNLIVTIIICWLVAVNGESYMRLFTWKGSCTDLENKAIEAMEENNVDTVLFYDVTYGTEVSHILRAKMPEIKSYSIEYSFTSAETLDFYKNAGDSEELGKKNILFITQDNFIKLPEYIQNRYTFIDQFNDMVYYYTDNSPCDFSAGFPGQHSEVSTDYPYTIGYSSENGMISPDDGSVTSDGTEGQVMQGVFKLPDDFKERDYSIELQYNIIDSAKNNPATLFLWADKTIIASEDLESDSTKIILDNIDFISADYLTLSVLQGYGTVLKIDKIIFRAD